MTARRQDPFSLRLYRRLLTRLPGGLAADYRDDMVALLRDRLAERGAPGRSLVWLSAWADLLRDLAGGSRGRRSRLPRIDSPIESYRMRIDTLLQDVRFAFRTLRRRPLFAAMTIATLGLGIGAATAMFSVVNGVLLREIPYSEPDRLVTVWRMNEGMLEIGGGFAEMWDHIPLSYPIYVDVAENNTTLDGIGIYLADEYYKATATSHGPPEMLHVGWASHSVAPTLGVRMELGRWFAPEEDGAIDVEGQAVSVLSHALWQGRFDGDAGIIGETITINDHEHLVVGVLPPEFRLHWLGPTLGGRSTATPRDLWLPLGHDAPLGGDGDFSWEAVARLAPGVSPDQAAADVEPIVTAHTDWDNTHVRVVPRIEDTAAGLTAPLVLLLGATLVLLLIACGNIATLSLGELHVRRQEIATRAALGAGRARVIRQLLTESCTMGLLGSGLGALLAFGGTHALLRVSPRLQRLDEVSVDLRVLAFTALVGVIAGVISGLAPALANARTSGSLALRSSSSVATPSVRLSAIVVAAEIALTLTLLVAGGLLARSLIALMAVDPGIDPRGVATVTVDLPLPRYEETDTRRRFVDAVLDRLRALPGVTGATIAHGLPFPGDRSGTWGVEILGAQGEEPDGTSARFYDVGPDYHAILSIPVLSGRALLPTDTGERTGAILISESFARQHWPASSPLGARLRLPGDTPPLTVVGVVADVRRQTLEAEVQRAFYVAYDQFPRRQFNLVVKGDGEPRRFFPAIREAVWAIDADLAVSQETTMEQLIAASASDARYATLLMNAFGAVALTLAAVGIFGVTARAVVHATRELGIRLALGAHPSRLIRESVRRSLGTAAAGTALGLVGAAWGSGLLAGYLFGVQPLDAATFLGAAFLLLLICLAASYLPAQRIARVDPARVLRSD